MTPNHLIENSPAIVLPSLNSELAKLKTAMCRHLPPRALRLQILLAARKSVSNAGVLKALSSARRHNHAYP
ncbi:MAG: hypothetical protein ABI395_04195 [Sphingobium sp.]